MLTSQKQLWKAAWGEVNDKTNCSMQGHLHGDGCAFSEVVFRVL